MVAMDHAKHDIMTWCVAMDHTKHDINDMMGCNGSYEAHDIRIWCVANLKKLKAKWLGRIRIWNQENADSQLVYVLVSMVADNHNFDQDDDSWARRGSINRINFTIWSILWHYYTINHKGFAP